MPVPLRALDAASTRYCLVFILRGCVWGLGLAAVLEVLNVLGGRNFHVVVPGAIYRMAQPSGEQLAQVVRDYGIHTVVNLRGVSEPAPWYLEECRATNVLNVSQEDLPFSATRLPSWPALRRMVEVIDHSEYPLLFHCNRGIDRTGMAVAVALLLHTDATVEQARRQLGLRFGHLSIGRTGHMDQLFDLYEQWLAQQGQQHSRDLFRRWVAKDYCPGECRCELKVLNAEVLRGIPVKKAVALQVRAINTSIKPWHFSPGTNAGIKCQALIGLPDSDIQRQALAGMFEAVVPPGSSIDLTLALPPLPETGNYVLQLDLLDPQHAYFHHMGSGPLFVDVEVQ
jgi:hypothetical protein